MSFETIDKILENFDMCGKIMITGGEPLLCLDEIEYLIKKINDDEKVVGVIEITTNASILDPRMIDIFSEFVSKDEERLAYLRISNDPFHDVNQSKKAYDFYSNLTTDYHNIIVHYELQEGKLMPELRFAGRAKKMLTDINEYLPYADHLNFELKTPHRIRIQDGKVYCLLIVCPNGGIVFGEELSFDTEDGQVLGNIYDETVANIIDKNNDNCLLSCCDSLNVDWVNNNVLIFDPEFRGFLKKDFEKICNSSYVQLFVLYATTFIGKFILNRLLSLRKQAKERLPLLTPEEIISEIPMPYDIVEYVITKANYVVENSTYIGKEVTEKYSDCLTMEFYKKAIDEIEKKDYEKETGFELDKIARNANVKTCNDLLKFFVLTVYPYTIFTEAALWSWDDIRLTPVYSKLQNLNDAHKSGKIPPKNDSILLCMNNAIENGKRNDRAVEYDFLLSVDTFFDYYFGFSPRLNNVIKAIFSRIWDFTKFHVTNNNPDALPFDEAI